MNIATHAFLSLFLPPEDREPHTPRIHTIIQLSPAGEGSSHPPVEYYPSTLSHSWVIDPEREAPDLPRLRVQSVKQKRIPKANCTKTTFVITRPSRRSGMRENEDFEVVHLLFESWPAKSVPNSDGQRALRELMNVAYSVNTRPQYPNDGQLRGSGRALDPPILVHCAEGGRTGTFIALNSLLRSFKCIPSPYDDTHSPPKIPPSPLSPPPTGIALDPVLKEFDHLMDQRAHMVDNETQVCHCA
jgi:protein tyrosine phosphatase